MELDPLLATVRTLAHEVRSTLGAGLPQAAYARALQQSLRAAGLSASTAEVPLQFGSHDLGVGLRADLVVDARLALVITAGGTHDGAERARLRQLCERLPAPAAARVDFRDEGSGVDWVVEIPGETRPPRKPRPDARKGAERLTGVPPRS